MANASLGSEAAVFDQMNSCLEFGGFSIHGSSVARSILIFKCCLIAQSYSRLRCWGLLHFDGARNGWKFKKG
jgi:hypothetical protein